MELLRSDSRLGSLIILSGMVHTGGESLQKYINLQNDLGFSLYTALFDCCIVPTSDKGKKSEIEVSTNWCVTVEH